MLGNHIAGRIGDGDGIFATEIGGGRFELADQRLRRSCIHGLRSVKPSDHRCRRNDVARRLGGDVFDLLQGKTPGSLSKMSATT